MFNSSSQNRTIEYVSIKIKDIFTDGDSPLEKWIDDLNDRNIGELYLYHFVYGWMYLQDNKIVKLDKKGLLLYLNVAHSYIKYFFAPDIAFDFFYILYSDRFQRLQEELSKVRKSQHSSIGYFPGYFFGRILEYPLMNNNFDSRNYKSNLPWSTTELSDMFAHQINHLQNTLDENLK